MFKTIITAALVALSLGTAIAATTSPASAYYNSYSYNHSYYGHSYIYNHYNYGGY